jgi:hypothetical protein
MGAEGAAIQVSNNVRSILPAPRAARSTLDIGAEHFLGEQSVEVDPYPEYGDE